MQSLLAFKTQITGDPLGVLASWNHSLHFCQWQGVTCGRRHQRVVELDLQSSNLQGSLSPHVGNLSFLRRLDLHNNSFSHHIPQELGCLFRLRDLGLGNNTFSGVIPVNITSCSNLRYLDLQGNHLTGKIPIELGRLSNLEVLSFPVNNLVGEIPASFGNLSSIMEIYGLYNNLEGGIPSTIGQLKRLSVFTLFYNNLTGMIPSSLYNLSSLTVFDVTINNLQGMLPPNLFQTLPNLKGFGIGGNQVIGQIPVSISNASHLSILDMGTNNFLGKVPALSGLHNIRFLSLAENNLGEGEADDLSSLYSLPNNTKLEVLGVNDNNLGGELPEIVSNFSTTVRQIMFGRNQISGRIPIEIGNLINLEGLGLETNQLTGIIPTSIGNLKKLSIIAMHSNEITGNIPSSLGNITSLISLSLSRNKLQGRIPLTLGNCQNLLQLFLYRNQLNGSLPREVIGISSLTKSLDLSGNQFTGSLPIEVGKLVNLGVLDISDKLSGKIPTSLASCISLETLNLGGNLFQGIIPESLIALKAIQYLNFSHNNLTGQIPKFLKDLNLLMNLDLSFNELQGEVPIKGVFKNATGISVMENKNLCGGVPQLNLPKCSSNQSKNLLLVTVISCGLLGIILMVFFLLYYYYYMRKENKLPSQSTSEMSLRRVIYEDLCEATDGFSSSRLIGVGSFGSVYKGILEPDRIVVAVKVFNLLRKGALKSFMVECKALINIRHRNLIKILTICSSIDFQRNDFKTLVYEFMVNGNLEEWLYPIQISEETRDRRTLNLVQRLNIAIDVVSALDYLQHHCETPIIHCDLKPSNVLFDGDMVAHVGDFGLARFLQKASDQLSLNQSNSIGLKGTIGYAPPEYGMGSEVSTYGDTYSFGILLLEMFTGKRPTDIMLEDGLNLHNYVKVALPDSVLNIVDPILLQEREQMSVASSSIRKHSATHKYEECIIMVLKVGVGCSVELPRDRMDISSAEVELRHIRDILLRTRMHGQHDIVVLP